MTELDHPLTIQDNRFISGFFLPQQSNFQSLNEVTAEITFERTSWQNSGAAEQCLEELINIYEHNGLSHPYGNPKAWSQQLTRIRHSMYGHSESSQKTKNITHAYGKQAFYNLPSRLRQPLDEFARKIIDHGDRFEAAVKDLVDQRNTLSQELVENWRGFMSGGDVQSFADFGYFLGAEEFTPQREESRPFLEALQTRIDRMIDPITQSLIDNTMADITSNLFGEFVGQLSKQNSKQNRHSVTLQWLSLVSFPSTDVNPEVIIDKIKNGASLPDDLKTLLANYLQQRIKRDAEAVQSQLAFLKPAKVPTISLEFNAVNPARRAAGTTIQMVEPYKTTIKTEGEIPVEPEKPTYRLALHDHGPISPEQRENFIIDTADRFATGDQRMRLDIRNILSALEADPFGLGVAKLTSIKIASSEGMHRSLALRRFRADQRPGLTLNHEESKRLRVVFYLDPRTHPNEVIIHDILNHAEFDKTYT